MPRLGAQHTHTLTPQTTAVSSERARHQSGLESRWTTAPFACLKPLDRHGTKRKALPHRKCKGQGPQGESLSVKCQRYRLDPLLAALGAWDRNSNSTKSQDGHPSLGTLSFAQRRRKMETSIAWPRQEVILPVGTCGPVQVSRVLESPGTYRPQRHKFSPCWLPHKVRSGSRSGRSRLFALPGCLPGYSVTACPRGRGRHTEFWGPDGGG